MLALLLFATLGHPAPPVFWSLDIHRVVCEVAWQELTPATRAEVARLLATEHPAETFPDACTWADRVRPQQAYRWTAPAHYLNLPPGAAGVDVTRDCDTICVVTAIPRFLAVLTDASRSDSARREALKFVAHFVGDVHQPLHVSYERDLGGNRTAVRFLGDSTNLHRVWDGDLPRALGLEPGGGARLEAAIAPVERARWLRSLDPVTWANESFAIVETQVYADLDGGVAGHDYVERNRHTVIARVQAAGVRLAALLNRALGATGD